MYTLNHTTDVDIDTTFDELVEPIAVRATKPRCADGNGTLTHLFFSDIPLDTARAKAICSKCALADDCLAGALERAEPWGVWGGELLENGRVVVNKRPRGRPPKHPRPTVAVDEVPIPPHLLVRPRTELVRPRAEGARHRDEQVA